MSRKRYSTQLFDSDSPLASTLLKYVFKGLTDCSPFSRRVFLEKPRDDKRMAGSGQADLWSAEGNHSLDLHGNALFRQADFGELRTNAPQYHKPCPGPHKIMIGQGLSPFYLKS